MIEIGLDFNFSRELVSKFLSPYGLFRYDLDSDNEARLFMSVSMNGYLAR
jgi:hypothetical protein